MRSVHRTASCNGVWGFLYPSLIRGYRSMSCTRRSCPADGDTVRRRQGNTSSRRYTLAPVYLTTAAAACLITAGLMYLLVRRLNLSPLIAYLVAINTTTLLAYAFDKGVSGSKRQRVPERALHAFALFGGTPAAFLGQLAFRHKTRKRTFRVWFWIIALLQAAVLAGWMWVRVR